MIVTEVLENAIVILEKLAKSRLAVFLGPTVAA
jgi:hypothetical protein